MSDHFGGCLANARACSLNDLRSFVPLDVDMSSKNIFSLFSLKMGLSIVSLVGETGL